jgi:drug/metabolite transporter (DMT)-like permease
MVWGTSGVLVRATQMPAAQIACGRAIIGAVALGVWIYAMPRPDGLRKVKALAGRRATLAASGILLGVHWLTFVMALQRIPIGTVLLGIYLAPLAVAAMAKRTLGERLTVRRVAALGVALAGSVLVLRPQQTTGWGGLALIAFSALAYAGSLVASKRVLSTVAPVVVTMVQLGIVGLLLAPLVAVNPAPVGGRDLAVLVILGIVYSALTLLAYLAFLRQLPATTSGVLLYLEPVSALIAGWLFLGETPTAATLLGAVVVLLAQALAAVDSARAEAGIGATDTVVHQGSTHIRQTGGGVV